MMALTTMRRVVDTLDDAGASPLADEIVSRWAHDPGSTRYLRASANFLFTYRREGEPYALRFNHADERSAGMIYAELGFVRHLAAHNVRVAVPVTSLTGRAVESVLTSSGTYHAVSFQVLRGEQLDFGELTPRTLARWGRALGELHNASQGYSGLGRPTWRDHLGRVADELPADERAARGRLDEVTNRLSHLPIAETTFGLIHFDFELDNIIWQGDDVGALDFDNCASYWFVADIAFALRDLFGDRPGGVDVGHASFRAFVAGYREVREVRDEELRLIPPMLATHNLITFAKLRRTLRAGPASEPDWLTGLRGKLQKVMEDYRERFDDPLM